MCVWPLPTQQRLEVTQHKQHLFESCLAAGMKSQTCATKVFSSGTDGHHSKFRLVPQGDYVGKAWPGQLPEGGEKSTGFLFWVVLLFSVSLDLLVTFACRGPRPQFAPQTTNKYRDARTKIRRHQIFTNRMKQNKHATLNTTTNSPVNSIQRAKSKFARKN